MNHATSLTGIFCDIFCVVIDNYGDAAVCWRLARQLALEHGWRVRLWIDDPSPLYKLAPDFQNGPVKVAFWSDATDDPADVVIEAFGCELPVTYVAAMAKRPKPPVWLNLEYLSAEPWVAACHGMASPHPSLPLVKYFFFPGFEPGTGGLLRERDYEARRETFDVNEFRSEFGVPPRLSDELTISLFSYPNAALPRLLDAWASARQPVRLLIPGGTDAAFTRGNLSCHPLPFLTQLRYDELLWTCDLNFVRGEDSFVRAQWVAKPFVWHIYPQADQAHLVKLGAFLDLAFMPQEADPVAGATDIADVMAFWRAWNGDGELDWTAFSAALPALQEHAKRWKSHLLETPDLASGLVRFCHQSL